MLMHAWCLVAIAAAAAGCASARDRPTEIDLLTLLPTAERRPVGSGAEQIRADVVGIEGDVRAALVLRAPARVTWPVFLPIHAQLTTSLLLLPGVSETSQGVTLRIALSHERTYQELARVEATSAWAPIAIDLRQYSEWKFSLFDQPLRRRWMLIVSADATPGGTVALDRPRLTKS